MGRALQSHALGDASAVSDACGAHVVLYCFLLVGIRLGIFRCNIRARRMSNKSLRRKMITCPGVFTRMAVRQKRLETFCEATICRKLVVLALASFTGGTALGFNKLLYTCCCRQLIYGNLRQVAIILCCLYCRVAGVHCKTVFICRTLTAFIYCCSCYPRWEWCMIGIACGCFCPIFPACKFELQRAHSREHCAKENKRKV